MALLNYVPPEKIMELSQEEKDSLRKAYFKKIHEDYPGFDWLMINSLLDHYFQNPADTPESIVEHYRQHSHKHLQQKQDEANKDCDDPYLPQEEHQIKDPIHLKQMERNRSLAPGPEEQQAEFDLQEHKPKVEEIPTTSSSSG